MFNKNFYPTTKALIKKMLAPYKTDYVDQYDEPVYDFSGKIILEPSAGKADILDFIKEHGAPNMYAIEIDPNLNALLRGKGYAVITDDFLQYKGSDLCFDLIVMNPPFDNGVDHLLHAWDLIRGGDIVCLLNAQTVKNPNSKTKKLLKNIIDQHGSVEYIQNAFKTAERKTGVEIAIVRLHKEAAENEFDFFEGLRGAGQSENFEFDPNMLSNAPERADKIGNLVIRYNQCKAAYKELMKAQAIFYYHLDGLQDSNNKINWENVNSRNSDDEDETSPSAAKAEFNSFVKELKRTSWANIFTKTSIRNVITTKIAENFDEFSKQQGHVDFTRENIESLLQNLVLNSGKIMSDCLVDIFNKLTSYDKKNRVHWEGWKTNDAFKVNQKVIMPWFIEHDKWGSWNVTYRNGYRTQLDDIDKVMCLLTGKKVDQVLTLNQTLSLKFKKLNGYYDQRHISQAEKVERNLFEAYAANLNNDEFIAESEFFTLRFYKKGTLHITFKDAQLWQAFNMAAAKGKNWLPAEHDVKTGRETTKGDKEKMGKARKRKANKTFKSTTKVDNHSITILKKVHGDTLSGVVSNEVLSKKTGSTGEPAIELSGEPKLYEQLTLI